MNVLGIDPSSTSSGNALLELGDDGELNECVAIETFFPKPIDIRDFDGLARNLAEYSVWLSDFVGLYGLEGKLDLVVIERVHVTQNLDTVRKIAYYETIGMQYAASWEVPLLCVAASSARKHVLSKGNISKEQAHEEVLASYGDAFDWPELRPLKSGPNKGKLVQPEGLGDMLDAFVLARAGHGLWHEMNG